MSTIPTRRRAPFVALAFAATVALSVAACASAEPTAATNAKGAGPQIRIAQVVDGPDLLYFRGPVPLRYVLDIKNPLSEPVTLRRVTLRTQGRGAYSLNSEALGLKKTIPPGGSESIQLSTWGRSRGGFLSQSEPVTIVGTAVFDTPKGPLARFFTEYLPQPG
jgi:hypothetical protein